MTILGREAASPATEAPRIPVDGKKALNTKGFPEYLQKLAKAGKVSDPEALLRTEGGELDTRFTAYEVVNKTKKDIVNIYKTEIQRDLGIKMDDKDLAGIESFIEQQSIDSPEKMADLNEKIRIFTENKRLVLEKEQEFNTLKAEFESTQAKNNKEIIKTAQDAATEVGKHQGALDKSIIGQMRHANGLRGEVGQSGFNRFKKIFSTSRGLIKMKIKETEAAASKHIETKGAEIAEVRARLDALSHKKGAVDADFAEVRKALFTTVDEDGAFEDIVQQKVLEKLTADLTNPKDLKSVDKTSELMRRLQEKGTEGLIYAEDDKLQSMTEMLNTAAEEGAKKEITQAITKTKMDKNGAYDDLVKVLKPFVERSGLGTKGTEETKNFILETLNEQLENLKGKDDAKQYLLSYLIHQVESGATLG